MLFNLLFSFLSISQNATNITYGDDILGDRGCGLGSQDIFFINSQDDINKFFDFIISQLLKKDEG